MDIVQFGLQLRDYLLVSLFHSVVCIEPSPNSETTRLKDYFGLRKVEQNLVLNNNWQQKRNLQA